MLRLKYVLGLASYVGNLISATPIALVGNGQGSSLDLNSYLPSNGSAESPFNLTGSEDIHIQCDGASYGFDLDVSDCEEATAYVPPGRDQILWVERNSTSKEKHVPLPYRSMGSKATCYVQAVLGDGAASAEASANEVRNAAAMVRGKCYAGGKLQGGIATKIGKDFFFAKMFNRLMDLDKTFRRSFLVLTFYAGGDNNLAVIIGAYKSSTAIQCTGKLLFPETCIKVLDDMPATKNQEVFGIEREQSATVMLPDAIMSGRLVNQTTPSIPHPPVLTRMSNR